MINATRGRTDILAKIEAIAADILGTADLKLAEEMTAHDVPGWDSLTHVQIIVAVESAFGIRLNSTEIAQLENAGSLIDLVQKHSAANGAGA